MRKALSIALCGTAFLLVEPCLAQTGASQATAPGEAADLCKELLAFAEQKASESPKEASAQAPTTAAAPPPRGDAAQSGTQGGGSVDKSSSQDTSTQAAAPTTTPVAPGASSEPATSPHATDASEPAGASRPGTANDKAGFKLAADITVGNVRDTAREGDRQACRDTAQRLRRAGAEMPAALLALAAYEPDPAKR